MSERECVPLKALILVDLQNDFLPAGALPVPDGDQVIPLANQIQQRFDLVVATQDWHPSNHASFAAIHPGKMPGDVIDLDGLQQTLWPVHCVQNTVGSAFAPGLDISRVRKIIRKGTDPGIDSYSGFFDNGHRKSTGLDFYLKQAGVTETFVLGLATDYCVKFTAMDALELGFATYVLVDACRGVELQTGDVAAALHDMATAGVQIITGDASWKV
ncbi:MAG: bifunctional nicotinamidase/pyrazinamidase [Planctomycetes bacterium]|nr:bifunctional nicotinamidase/pyrazinamidase [Planctomycetota bacterium]